MAKYEDYLSTQEGAQAKVAEEGGIAGEIVKADSEQQARVDATPDVNWEERYKNLEKLNSQQAQALGTYRTMVDEYITKDPTPSESDSHVEDSPITSEDLYENPDEAVRRAVESHPAIKEARDIKAQLEAQQREADIASFGTRHPDYQEIAQSPEFATWVQGNPKVLGVFG